MNSSHSNTELWLQLTSLAEVLISRGSTSFSTLTCQMIPILIFTESEEQEDLELKGSQLPLFQEQRTLKFSRRFRRDLKSRLKNFVLQLRYLLPVRLIKRLRILVIN